MKSEEKGNPEMPAADAGALRAQMICFLDWI
jgi:hypothetical protein